MFLDLEAGAAQAIMEYLLRTCRPDREYPTGAQRVKRGLQPRGRVEPVVVAMGQAFWSIVDIEQDRIEGAALIL